MAQMNSGLILAQQPVNFLGAAAGAAQAAGLTNQVQRENALAALYRDQGAGILSGDQSAMNALAGLDPTTAFNMQQGRENTAIRRDAAALDAQATRQRMDILAAQEARAAQQYASGLTAEQRAAQAAEIEEGVRVGMAFHQAGDRTGYEAWAQQNGVNVPFERVPMEAARYMKMAEIVKGVEEPAAIQALRIRAQEAGLQPGTQQYSEFMRSNGRGDQGMVVYGPDGQPIVSTGGAKPFTEAQSKDNVYVTRAEGALQALEPVSGSMTSIGQRALNADPTGLVRGAAQTDDFQLAQQAGNEFLQAILRKDTGAAITSQEQELYGQTYLPQPGDNAAVLDQKRQARRRAIDAIRSGMSPAQMVSVERALNRNGSPPQQVNSREQYDALPSGAEYIAPDGKRRRKP